MTLLYQSVQYDGEQRALAGYLGRLDLVVEACSQPLPSANLNNCSLDSFDIGPCAAYLFSPGVRPGGLALAQGSCPYVQDSPGATSANALISAVWDYGMLASGPSAKISDFALTVGAI